MAPESISLLDRLKASRPDASDWHRLQDISLPLVHRWLSSVPGLGDDAADLAQEVLVVLVREISRFERQRRGRFACGCARARGSRSGPTRSNASGGPVG